MRLVLVKVMAQGIIETDQSVTPMEASASSLPGLSCSVRTKTACRADKMLDAAAHLFARHRFHEVRMEDIAAEADVGKGTLYRYFSDKEELFLALLDRAARQVGERIAAAMAQADGPRQKLEVLATALIVFFDEQPHVFDLIQRAEVLHSAGGAFPWQKTRDLLAALALDVFREAGERGEFVITDPDTALYMLLGGIRGVTRFGRRPRPPDLGRRVVTGFLEGAGAMARDSGLSG
jgi:AcrR family transcriptional regulator